MDYRALRDALFSGQSKPGENDKDQHRGASRTITDAAMRAGLSGDAASAIADALGLANEAAVSDGMTRMGPTGFDVDDIAANRSGQAQAVDEFDPNLLSAALSGMPIQQLLNLIAAATSGRDPAAEQGVPGPPPMPPVEAPRAPMDVQRGTGLVTPEIAAFLRSKR